jgi:alkaline phosphatase D
VVGSELVRASITSTGNGTGATTDPTMAGNPHLKFPNDERGYVNTHITKDAMAADLGRSLLRPLQAPPAPL